MPRVADVEIIAKTFGSILAAKPQSHGALTVIPILAPMQAEPEWLTLAEVGDRVRITEVSDEGSVPELKVANLGDPPPLLLDGEQLVGAKQSRILNMTVLVAAKTEVTIPVSCVEQGRWGYRARHSAPSEFSLYAGLRAKKSAWVSRSLREGRGHAADQQDVWEGLAQKAEAHDGQSPTGAMHDFYARYGLKIPRLRTRSQPRRVRLGPGRPRPRESRPGRSRRTPSLSWHRGSPPLSLARSFVLLYPHLGVIVEPVTLSIAYARLTNLVSKPAQHPSHSWKNQ